jgi:hypothetical protein
MTDTSLITFKAIASFTKDLGEVFASNQHSLKLYCHLIQKTTLSHEKAIKKHIDAFRKFSIENRDAIEQKDHTKLKSTKIGKIKSGSRIEYSKNVYIDISAIFKIADEDTRNVIWKHLLVISALCDPTSAAKKILKASSDKNSVKETDFIADIISKVETHVKPDSNPIEAVSSIMKSGVFTDIVTNLNKGMSDGSLDLAKLIGNVQNMVTTINSVKQGGSEENINNINNTNNNANIPDLSDMLKNLSSIENKDANNSQPDISGLLSMMGPMMAPMMANMANMTNSQSKGEGGAPDIMNIMSSISSMRDSKSIEEKINEQVEKSKKHKKLEIEEID